MRCYQAIPTAALLFAIVACAGHTPMQTGPVRSPHVATVAPSARTLVNGRSIFQTGRDLGRVQIVAEKPPLRQSCAACHGSNGAGGVHLPGGAVSADLRYKALVLLQHRPYTIALLERAISTGFDNQGQPLNPVMPRWRLSNQDLHDVAFYVMHTLK